MVLEVDGRVRPDRLKSPVKVSLVLPGLPELSGTGGEEIFKVDEQFLPPAGFVSRRDNGEGFLGNVARAEVTDDRRQFRTDTGVAARLLLVPVEVVPPVGDDGIDRREAERRVVDLGTDQLPGWLQDPEAFGNYRGRISNVLKGPDGDHPVERSIRKGQRTRVTFDQVNPARPYLGRMETTGGRKVGATDVEAGENKMGPAPAEDLQLRTYRATDLKH